MGWVARILVSAAPRLTGALSRTQSAAPASTKSVGMRADAAARFACAASGSPE